MIWRQMNPCRSPTAPCSRCCQIQTSLIVSPLIARGRSIGEILIGSTHRNLFDYNDHQSLETAASQIATAIERASLIDQTDESLSAGLMR